MREDRVELEHYIGVFRRRWWIISSVMVLTLVFSIIYYIKAPPVYETSTTMLIRQKPVGIFGTTNYQVVSGNEMVNHTLLLKSQSLMKMVAENFPDSALALSGLSSREEAFRRILSDIYSGRIQIEPLRNSNIIKITVQESNPFMAYYFANGIAQNYQKFDIQNKKLQVSALKEFVEAQLKKMEKVLKESEEKLKEYKKKHLTLEISSETSALVEKLTDFEAEYQRLFVEKEALKKRLNLIQSRMDNQQKKLLETTWESILPLIEDLRSSLAELENERSRLLIQGFSKDDPKVLSIQKRIDNTRKALKDKVSELFSSDETPDPVGNIQELLKQSILLKIDLASLEAKEGAYRKILKKYRAKLESIPDREIELARLERERKANEKIYMMLLEKSEEARITEASEIGDVILLDQAPLVKTPLKLPKTKKTIFFIFLGLIISLGLAFIVDYFDPSIKSDEEVSAILKVPALGLIPRMDGEDGFLYVMEHPDSHVAEAFRTLRTNIVLSSPKEKPGVILITSLTTGEGKSFVSSNLAYSFSLSKKTLLIDADMRKPRLYQAMNVERSPGLSDYLSGELKKPPIVKVDGLYFLPSGSFSPSPVELLDSERMRKLLIDLKEIYDVIILDSPPLFSVADAVVLSARVDSMALVISHGETPRPLLLRAKDQLSSQNNLLGFIMNKINIQREYRYYHYYHREYTS